MATHDLRIVNYGYIHDHKPEYFNAFVGAMDITDGLQILDPFCGYGEVIEKIIDRTRAMGVSCSYTLSDCSQTQVDRAIAAFEGSSESVDILLADAASMPYEDNSFDRVVIKMGLHEIPESQQRTILGEVYRVLRPGGKFVTWEIGMDTPDQLAIFRDVIYAKNRIAGFYDINRSRHFHTERSLLDMIAQADFVGVQKVYDIRYTMKTFHRKSELVSVERALLAKRKKVIDKHDEAFLEELSRYRLSEFEKCVREIVVPEKRELVNYCEDLDGTVGIDAYKVIVVASK